MIMCVEGIETLTTESTLTLHHYCCLLMMMVFKPAQLKNLDDVTKLKHGASPEATLLCQRSEPATVLKLASLYATQSKSKLSYNREHLHSNPEVRSD